MFAFSPSSIFIFLICSIFLGFIAIFSINFVNSISGNIYLPRSPNAVSRPIIPLAALLNSIFLCMGPGHYKKAFYIL